MYALLLRRIEDDVRAERQVVAALVAGGAKVVEEPDMETAHERFDQALEAAPVKVDTERLELLAALGLR